MREVPAPERPIFSCVDTGYYFMSLSDGCGCLAARDRFRTAPEFLMPISIEPCVGALSMVELTCPCIRLGRAELSYIYDDLSLLMFIMPFEPMTSVFFPP